MTILWVNDAIHPVDTPALYADDHGVTTGDGVFETCKLVGGVPFALTRHLARLARSAALLGLTVDLDAVRAAVAAVCAQFPAELGRLRITLTGGRAPLASDRGERGPTLIVAAAPLAPWPQATDVVTVPWCRNERAATAGAKTTSYADNVVVLAEAHRRGASEALLANTRGELCEGTGTNVVVVRGGEASTPPLSSGCLAGVTRELLLEWCPDLVSERSLPFDALADAEEILLTSSTRDVMPVRALDGRALPAGAPGPVTRALAEAFARRAAADPDP